ncbi:AraC family transcriptional regulator [[Erwinia] mediterraneensis]|uniref:AraC family transcriptional regulator n=1 Tax=[Erwinia] mediterraneensis TaxID=2161819 RepID=UPI001032674C|nr:AraC family transcriptional regulator [[Erwinia] mediterraneensis]
MDPLSGVLALLKPQSYVSGGVAIAHHRAIQWPQHAGIKCYAVVNGQCWLTVSGIEQPLLLTAGECYLLPPGPAFCLATDLQAAPEDFTQLRDRLASDKDNAGCFLVGGHFMLTGYPADLLLDSLPPVVHIQKMADKRIMRWSLERMAEEVRNPQPGSTLIIQQLAYMLLVQALRLYISDQDNSGKGWLFALADKQLSCAISAMQSDPGYPWTLASLAKYAGMSRSIFALRFRQIVGMPPVEYLTRWRMLLAKERLENTADSLSQIATTLGYESESAFGKAFKRVTGTTPGQYGRRSKRVPDNRP